MLERLNDLLQDKHGIHKVMEDAGDRTDPARKINVQARMDFAGSLVSDKKFDQATGECLWLWEHMLEHDDYLEFERMHFLPIIMVRLAEQFEPAQVAFTKLRDAARKEMDAGSEIRDVIFDWFTLCEILGDDDGILAWFDKTKHNHKNSDVISHMDTSLFNLLVKHKRWADTGFLEVVPVARAQSSIDMNKRLFAMDQGDDQFDAEFNAMIAKTSNEELMKNLPQQYACCLAVELDEEAIQIANIFLEYRDNPEARIALVQWAMRANQPRKEQLQGLDDAAENGRYVKALRQKVQDALAK